MNDLSPKETELTKNFSTEVLFSILENVDLQYRKHRNIVMSSLQENKIDMDQNLTHAGGGKSISEWLMHAKNFYITIIDNESILNQMSQHGYTRENLVEIHDLVKRVESVYGAQMDRKKLKNECRG